ncbi:MAG: hypothetical protein JWM81_592 [Candidatus Saccharibacteria bacterium]|nr:hypothetical protein [Candidatus Saccharibacteria bacterium]
MKASAVKYAVLSMVASLVVLTMVLMPFHAILTVWTASIFGHYTLLRLWKETLLFIAGLGVVYLMLTDRKIRTHTLSRRLVWLIAAYALLQAAVGLIALHNNVVTPKALAYGWLLDLRFLVFFLVCWAVALRTARLQSNWFKILVVPAAIVVGFGLLQIFVLPHDFLRHFGYSAATIDPVDTINKNNNYIRIFSTLRGPNPLGAYLILPITVITAALLRSRRNWQLWALLVASVIVLFFSRSRSALIGALLSTAVLLLLSLRSRVAKQRLAVAGGVIVVVVISLVLSLRHNSTYQNLVLHTQTGTTATTSSNDGHVAALKNGLHDVAHQPLGRGAGTAGPASIYNNHQSRIAENYFVQLAQEVGILGLGLFLVINAGIGYLLWLRRTSPLALCLFTSLIGISVVNLLLHAWADDTLAYVWWGLAGVAMATLPITPLADPVEVPIHEA